jgi:cytochrome c-type biogenesis protein
MLALIAFLAGVATVTAPCVLPVLPVVLAAGATGDRWRPAGIVVGLVISFSAAILILSSLVLSLGLHPDVLRWVAAVLLFSIGLVIAVPALSTPLEGFLSRVVGSRAVASKGSGFGSGVLVGLGLGLVWVPCAGPVLAALITLIATVGATAQIAGLTFMYALGAAIPLGLIAWGGQALRRRIKITGRYVGPIFGGLMIAAAIAIFFGLDRELQAWVIQSFPTSVGIIEWIESREAFTEGVQRLQR